MTLRSGGGQLPPLPFGTSHQSSLPARSSYTLHVFSWTKISKKWKALCMRTVPETENKMRSWRPSLWEVHQAEGRNRMQLSSGPVNTYKRCCKISTWMGSSVDGLGPVFTEPVSYRVLSHYAPFVCPDGTYCPSIPVVEVPHICQ
jgi:hypothetical protein